MSSLPDGRYALRGYFFFACFRCARFIGKEKTSHSRRTLSEILGQRMLEIEEVREKQKIFIQNQIEITEEFIRTKLSNVEEIKSVLLSGSVARGTFMPGKFGGAIDLTLIVDDILTFDKEKYLGKMEELRPEYLIRVNENYFQFVFYDNEKLNNFRNLSEAKKYALLESKIILDKNNEYSKILQNQIIKIKETEIIDNLKKTNDYIHYLLSEYKVDRWKKRNAVIQLHSNLNKAVECYIKCLFYKNGFYSPAEDRDLYFSFNLTNLPNDYKKNINEVFKIFDFDIKNYERREKIFKEQLLVFLNNLPQNF